MSPTTTTSKKRRLSVDVYAELCRLLPEMNRLVEAQQAQVDCGEYLKADEIKSRVKGIVGELKLLNVCPGCWIVKPSVQTRARGVEQWRGNVCPFCRNYSDPMKGIQKHREDALISLCKRVYCEVIMVTSIIPSATSGKLIASLDWALKSVYCKLGQGGGLRHGRKNVDETWLIAQLYMTKERLALEPTLTTQQRAVTIALEVLQAR